MEEAWSSIGNGKAMAKLAVKRLVGLWCIDEMHVYKVSSSRWERDRPAGALQRECVYPGGKIYDFVQKVEIRSTMSHRPLHDLWLVQEHIFVGSMRYALRRHRATILELKTDSVLYRPAKSSGCVCQI